MEKALDKIKKLLALATSDNENEAKLAMTKAQELALSNGLDIRNVSGLESEREVIGKFIEESTKGISPYRKDLAFLIGENFRVDVIFARGINRMNIIGYPEDVENFMVVYEFAYKTFETLFKKHLKGAQTASRNASMEIKASYYKGFKAGILAAFKANVTEKGLVLVLPDAVTTFVEKNFKIKIIKDHIFGKTFNGDAYFQGREDGKAAVSPQIEKY